MGGSEYTNAVLMDEFSGGMGFDAPVVWSMMHFRFNWENVSLSNYHWLNQKKKKMHLKLLLLLQNHHHPQSPHPIHSVSFPSMIWIHSTPKYKTATSKPLGPSSKTKPKHSKNCTLNSPIAKQPRIYSKSINSWNKFQSLLVIYDCWPIAFTLANVWRVLMKNQIFDNVGR